MRMTWSGWSRTLTAALLGLVLARPATAETAGAAEARAAFRALTDVEARQPPRKSGSIATEEASLAAARAWRREMEEAKAAWRKAFAASDWENWTWSEEDAALLERGLVEEGEAALAREDGPTATAAFDRASTFTRLEPATAARVADGRPAAHLANGDPDRARALAAAAAKGSTPEDLPVALLRQGDLEWALGRTAEARAFYAKASEHAAEESTAVFGQGEVAAFVAKGKLGLLDHRVAVSEPTWVVGEETSKWLGRSAERVVLFVFPDPYQAERFDPAPYARWTTAGVAVAGVLAQPMTLRLPEALLDYPTTSTPRLRGEPQPKDLGDWAARLRRVAKAEFPFVGLPPAELPLGRALLGSALAIDADGRALYFQAPGEPVSYVAAALARATRPR